MQSMGSKLSILGRIKQSKFARNTATLFSGTVLAQLIAIFSYPFLSRLYSPESFGILAIVMAISSIVIPIATLRYESAIVIEQGDENVLKIQGLCVTALFWASIATLLFLVFFPSLFDSVTELNVSSGYVYFAVPIIFLFGLANVLYARLNREGSYKLLSIGHVIRKFSIVLFQVIFYFFGLTSLGLILGNLLGVMVAVFVILYFGKVIFSNFLSRGFYNKDVAIRYLDFPKYSAPQSLVNSVMAQLPIVAFAFSYGAAVSGALYFAMKIVQLPITFMGQSVRTVFLKHASDNRDNVPYIFELFNRITLLLAVLIIGPMGVLFFYGPDLFILIFGSEWRQAGVFSSWLMVWFGGNFVQQPARALFIVFEEQKKLLLIDIFLGLARSLGLLLSIVYYDGLTAIAMYSLISVIFFTLTVVGWFVFLRNRCLN